MPAGSRAQQRAEAKYNITTDFPRYDLHFAAASGDLGLVEFALSHGQPVNSVLNGVLPLHAACAGGSEVVVKYLIDEGADVNAPRVPRRYSNDRHRSSALAVGASGSTPLHFAAANGHLSIIRVLLAHGAVPSRADKHGVTPAALARENGWIECADALDMAAEQRDYGNDADYELEGSEEGHSSKAHDALEAVQHVLHTVSGTGSRKLHVKRSIDNAFHLFKHNHHPHSNSSINQHGQRRRELSPTTGKHIHHHSSHQHLRSATTLPIAASDPPSPVSVRPLGDYTFYPVSSSPSPYSEQRRPSLPHVFGGSSSSILPGSAGPSTSFRGKAHEGAGKRRPRSAGTGAEQQQVPGQFAAASPDVASSTNTSPGPSLAHAPPRRLGSKLSLMHLFKRANGGGSGEVSGNASSVEENGAQILSSSMNGANASPASSPVPIVRPKISTSAALASSPALSTSPSSPSPSPSPSTRRPTAVDLHHQISRERLERVRLRAHASGSSVFEEDEEDDTVHPHPLRQMSITTSTNSMAGPVRPSILRTHNRSSSSHSSGDLSHLQQPSVPNSARTLRFDSSASPSPSGSIYPSPASSSTHVPSYGTRKVSTASKLRSSRSANSIGSRDSLRLGSQTDESGAIEAYAHPSDVPESAPAKVLSFQEPLRQTTGRARGPSFASSTSESSPGLQSPGEQGSDGGNTYSRGEYPFSIASPPLRQIDLSEGNDEMDAGVEVADHDQEKLGRGRGLSISSVETDVSEIVDGEFSNNSSTTSAQASMAFSSSISGKGEMHVYGRRDPTVGDVSPASSCEDLGAPIPPSQGILRDIMSPNRAPFAPLDLRSISNYAEVKDLAQLAEQEILRTASLSENDPESASGASLAAQLAAYGEILALEKKFKRDERQRVMWSQQSDSEGEEGEEGVNCSDRVSKSAGYLGHRAPKMSRVPMSAPVGERDGAEDSKGMTRSVSTSQAVDSTNSSPSQMANHRRPSHGAKEPKVRRPHTAEGAPKGEWGNDHERTSERTTPVGSAADVATGNNRFVHPRSMSTPLRLNGEALKNSSTPSDIRIIETVPTPVDSPRTPDIVPPAAVRHSLDSSRPVTPITHEYEKPSHLTHSDNETIRFGVPLTRVATAPSIEKQGYDFHHNEDISTRQNANASKLARMGFTPDNTIHPQMLNYTSTRSPTKARFPGIKSLVQTLKGR